MKHLLILISIFLFSSPLFGQSGKPQTIIIPTGSLGEMSKVRIKILEKTLESKLDDYFAIVPKELFEEAQEQAFQEMESDECTEDQCILMIKEILQIENAFKMELISEDADTQISITWNDQDQKRVMTPSDAIRSGSSILVVGRPVTEAKNPELTVNQIIKEIS